MRLLGPLLAVAIAIRYLALPLLLDLIVAAVQALNSRLHPLSWLKRYTTISTPTLCLQNLYLALGVAQMKVFGLTFLRLMAPAVVMLQRM